MTASEADRIFGRSGIWNNGCSAVCTTLPAQLWSAAEHAVVPNPITWQMGAMICKFSARLLAGALCAALSLSAAPGGGRVGGGRQKRPPQKNKQKNST